MKKMLVAVFLVMTLAACKTKDSLVRLSTATPPFQNTNLAVSTATLPSELLEQQVAAQRKWENGGHAHTNNVVNCDNCHRVQDGMATKGIAWLNKDVDQYEPVDTAAELCQRCHQNYNSGTNAHKEFTCLDCHDQHEVTASCFSCHKQIKQALIEIPATPVDGHASGALAFCDGSGCHSVATQVAQMPPSNHGSVHKNVTCEACHDGGELAVGPLQDGGIWVPWLETEINGELSLIPHHSHDLSFEVDCSRCHFENNPWELVPKRDSKSEN